MIDLDFFTYSWTSDADFNQSLVHGKLLYTPYLTEQLDSKAMVFVRIVC